MSACKPSLKITFILQNLLASDDWTGLPLLLGCVGLANMEFLYYARAREHIKSKGTFQQALTFT